MTSTSAPRIQRPPIRTVTSGISRAPGHPSSHISPQQPRSIPHQLSIDLIPELASFRDSSKPVVKRQKLDSSQDTTQTIDLTISESTPEPSGQLSRQITLNDANPTDPIKGPEISAVRAGVQEKPTPPFPQALGKISNGIGRKDSGSLKIAVREEVQARPYSLEIPKIAPQYGDNAPADFFPWTGNHPEDILNENSTRNGYYDRNERNERSQTPQNETMGARASVWSNLKNRSGVQILSSLFASALDQRHEYGTVTASCTFKPPPRVILTDTKREAWLRDLANPTIPLRRLSRTIPHGIKGKALLDHCMTKNIPTWRAVWLAKCVGANELRAFKRKGNNGAFTAGGEAKWIKDWTTSVEQFIEVVLDSCGGLDWKIKITYGLQLVTHIYSEHLLDEDQFFDWMLTSFMSSETDRLPIWLLIAQLFWKDVWRYRHRGRRLAEAMLNHLHAVNHKEISSTYEPIQAQLATMLRSCVKSFPDCFVLPSYWSKHETTLKSCSNKHDLNFTHALSILSTRNAKFKRVFNECDLAASGTIRCRLINVLDSIPLRFDLPAVSEECLAVVNEYNLLIATVIEWASTRYRNRADRVYIAVRLLRRWRKQGVSLDNPISTFVGQCSTLAGLLRANVSKIVAELVRSSNFSISKYMQWLISRGPANAGNEEHGEDDFPSALLMELPLHGLPQHVLSLRKILLKNVGHHPVKEEETIQMVKMILAEKLPDLLVGSNSDRLSSGALELPMNLRGTVKSEISLWIRQSLVSRLRQEEDSFQGQTDISMSKILTSSQLQMICATLEEYGEFAVLADVLSLASNSNDSSLLAAVVMVVNRHLDIFWAIGAAQEMFHELLAQSANCLNRDTPAKVLLLSLMDLGEQLPNATRQIRQLRKQVALCDSKPSLSACSPVSDHVTGVSQSTEVNFMEEMESLLSSGNSMDKQTLSRIFATITKRLEKSWRDNQQVTGDHYALLDQLFTFDKEVFTQLTLNWLDGIQVVLERPKMLEILAPLVCSGTLQLQVYFERVVNQIDKIKDSGTRTRLAIETLGLLVEKLEDIKEVNNSDHQASSNGGYFTPLPRGYRYYSAQRQVIYDRPDITSKLILEVLGSNAHRDAHGSCRACNLVLRSAFPQVMQSIAIQCTSIRQEIEQQLSLQSQHYPITHLLDVILGLTDTASRSKAAGQELRWLLDSVNDFNAIFCQLKLLTILDGPQNSQKDSDIITDQVISLLIQRLSSPTKLEPAPWAYLVQKLSNNRALKFHEQITSILFASLPHVMVNTEDAQKRAVTHKNVVKSLLHSIDVVESQIPKSASISVVAKIDEKLRSLHSLPLFQASNVARTVSDRILLSKSNEFEGICTSVDIILRFVVVHLNMLRHPSLSPAMLARLLVGLSLLLVHPLFRSHSTFSSHIFDTIGLLSDCLSLETRHLCVRTLRDQYQIRDTRLQFLVGYSGNIDGERLRLVTNGTSIPSSATAGASPASSSSNAPNATISVPFAIRRWEMVQDATPIIGENDTSLSLSLFGARKAII